MVNIGKVLVTGANGFIGATLCDTLRSKGIDVKAIVRRNANLSDPFVGNLSPDTNWIAPLSGCKTIIHLAARVHVLADRALDPQEEFRLVNLHGTLKLARQAAESGVNRFVFVSSIGVNGAETFSTPFREDGPPTPHSPYALSKYEAEIELKKLAQKTGMEVVIIRPPLVYGARSPGNFGTLVRWLSSGMPLPLGAVHNRRSYVAVANLVDMLVTCIDHPAAANQLFLVSDGEDLSTTDLLRRLGNCMGRPAHLLPIPTALLKFAANFVGKPELAQRLCGNLQVDISKARQLLGWTPPSCVDEGLKRAVEGYCREASV